jgi:hypothetical protein
MDWMSETTRHKEIAWLRSLRPEATRNQQGTRLDNFLSLYASHLQTHRLVSAELRAELALCLKSEIDRHLSETI